MLAIDQGDYAAGGARLEEALEHHRSRGDRPGTARALRAMAYHAMRRNAEDRASALAAEAATVYREIGDVAGENASTHLMATVAIGRGDYAAARPLLELTEAFHRKIGDLRSLAIDCYSLAQVLAGLGELDAAGRYGAESVAIAERLGDTQTLAYATYVVGWVAIERRDAAGALEAFKRSLELALSVGDEAATIYTVEGIATALAIAGSDGRVALAQRSIQLSAAAAAERRAADQALSKHEQSLLDKRLANGRQLLTVEDLEAAEARGAALSFSDAVAEALASSID